jgi:radical SAM protein with 4Fe4S-binding SPASM domain
LKGNRIVGRDLTHLLLGPKGGGPGSCRYAASSVGASSANAFDVADTTPDDEAGTYYWNLFAYPMSLGSERYVFLSDRKSVISVDEATYRDVERAHGAAIPEALSAELVPKLLECGLVMRESGPRQFANVFAAKASVPKENALLHLITSYTCNLTCSYCFMLADLDDHKERFLSFVDARRGIDLYFGMPHKKDSVIHFYGGEPLLHPQLIDDCLAYIHTNYSDEVLPKIITNGTPHGRQVLDLLGKYTFDLSVSMDGDRKAHDVFRLDHQGRSTFDKTVEGVRAFQEIGCNPKILVTVGAHNIRRLPEVVSAVLDLSPQAIALNFPRELPRTDSGLHGDSADPAFWVKQYERCLELCYARAVPELYFADMLYAFLSGEPVLSPCAACGSQVSVGPGGQVGPCQAFVAAGMFSQPIEQFGAGGSSDPFQSWAGVSKASSRQCSRCAIAPICGGDCSFDRYNRAKSLYEPLEFHCDLRFLMADQLVKRLVRGEGLGFTAKV